MVKNQIATFGAGCFWGIQLVFSELKGVISTEVGYMGGNENYKNLSYEEVCTNETRHAEVVQVKYDPTKIIYKKLLDVFWENHDPTTLNRQGPDIGTQYRSVIFYHTEQQKEEALKSKDGTQRKLGPEVQVVTEVIKAGKFYKAEEYHQNYLKKRGANVCH